MCQFVLIKHFEKEKKFRHLPIVVMDVGYSNEVIKFKTFYKNLEDLLASSVQSTKYQSRQFTWKTPPFVIIVSNHPSQVEHLSADRLVPYAIDDKPGHVLMEDTLTLKKLKDFADKQSKSAAQRSERIRSGPGSVQPLPHPPLGATPNKPGYWKTLLAEDHSSPDYVLFAQVQPSSRLCKLFDLITQDWEDNSEPTICAYLCGDVREFSGASQPNRTRNNLYLCLQNSKAEVKQWLDDNFDQYYRLDDNSVTLRGSAIFTTMQQAGFVGTESHVYKYIRDRFGNDTSPDYDQDVKETKTNGFVHFKGFSLLPSARVDQSPSPMSTPPPSVNPNLPPRNLGSSYDASPGPAQPECPRSRSPPAREDSAVDHAASNMRRALDIEELGGDAGASASGAAASDSGASASGAAASE